MAGISKYNDGAPIAEIPQEEEGIDIIALLRKVWKGRKTVFISLGVCFVLGVAIALTSPKEYTVTSIMMPQLGSSTGGGSLGSLASLAGINLSGGVPSGELSPLMYPKMVESVPFRLELLDTPLNFDEESGPITLYDYFTKKKKPSVSGVIAKYTIGLPGVILRAIRGKQPEQNFSSAGADGIPMPITLTKKQAELVKTVSKMVFLEVDNKQGHLTLIVKGPEALATAQLAERAQQLLQEEIIKFKVDKSQSELNFIQDRYDEVKAETEDLQAQVARFTDRSQGMVNTYSQLYQTRIRNKYNISNSVYQELAARLEQAKLQVKKDTPTFCIIEPVVVPSQRSAPSRAKIVVIWLFLGAMIGVGIVLLKEQFVPDLKKKWEEAE